MSGSAEERPGRVLVVDDNDANRALLRDLLEARGYHVAEARDGSEGLLRTIIDDPPEVLLLDIMLPGIDGLTLCKRLKDDQRTASIPVLLITSNDDREVRLNGIANGANDFLLKPIDTQDAMLRVRNALGMKRMIDRANEAFAQIRAMEFLRDRLTTMIVHDMRSPLTCIQGYLEMYLHQTAAAAAAAGGDRLRGYVSKAFEQSAVLIGMVDSVLEVSRLESGKLPLTRIRCDLRDLALRVLDQVQEQAQGKRVSVHLDSGPAMAIADAAMISRVLSNLVSNAVKYTRPDDSVEVRIQPFPDHQRITVTDHGPGIPDDLRQRVFEKFATADLIDGDPKSIGLGLYFCKLVVDAHGGAVGVDSVPGEGSSFWFKLPYA